MVSDALGAYDVIKLYEEWWHLKMLSCDAFGIEEHGVFKGKSRTYQSCIQKQRTTKTNRTKFFDCYIASLSPVAAVTKGTLVDLLLVDGNN